MHKWLQRGLWISATFILVWLIVIYSWRTNNRMPNTLDVVFYFFALPAGILIILWLLAKTWERTLQKNDPSPTPNTDNQSKQADQTAENERALSTVILACAVRTLHGNSVEELSEKLKSSNIKPKLDEELTDSHGYPILAGRISDLDVATSTTAFFDWIITRQQEELLWTDEQLRSMALGSEIITELAQQVVKHPLLASFNAKQPERRIANQNPELDSSAKINAQPERRTRLSLPTLRLINLLQKNLEPEQSKCMTDWFSFLLQQHGWPAEKIITSLETQISDAQAFIAIDRLMLASFRQSLPCFSLVLACESFIGANTVEQWESAGKLFTGQDNVTSIPGEGAAGLLLADPGQARLFGMESSASIHRVAQKHREKSADSKGNINGQVLTDVVQEALALGQISAEKITLLSTDTDQRASRVMELMDTGFKIFPEIDTNTQYFKVTGHCGAMGSVTALVTLALAYQEVTGNSGSALCISNHDAYERTAAIIDLWPKPPTPLATHT